MQGVVKVWRETFGFITPDDRSHDVFVHFSHVQGDGFRELREGQLVEYDLAPTERGMQAVSVEVIAEAAAEEGADAAAGG